MQVSEIMTRQIETIHSDSMVGQAAKKMKSLDVGVLPVQERDQVVGVITDRDIVVRVIAKDRDPRTTQVSKVMTREVICCSEQESVEEAAKIMEDKRIHRLIVLGSDNKPIGIFTLSDLAVKARNEHLTWEIFERIAEPACPHR